MTGKLSSLKNFASSLIDFAGGPARVQVIVLLAAVLGLDAADKGTLSAISDALKHEFHVNNTEIGLLFAVVSFTGAFTTLPFGVLVDRINRRNVLAVTILLWSLAMASSGLATSYIFLLATRLGLAAVTAAAWPCVASMTGDFFPARERGQIFGWIISGELVGAGLGFLISGEVSSFTDWRWSFFTMAVPPIVIAWIVWRFLPEPARGAQSWLEPGERDPEAAAEPHQHPDDKGAAKAAVAPKVAEKAKHDYGIEPRPGMVLRQDPTGLRWFRAMGYLLRIPTYDLLIVASSLAYYFFAGIRSFAMIYFTEHYGLSRSSMAALAVVFGIGAIVGLVMGGRISQRLIDKGYINARIVVPAAALILSVPLFGFGIWSTSWWIGTILMTAGSAVLACAIAPIDAARLDIVHPRIWGRGEAGRMSLRWLLEGGAPLLFGAVSVWLGGGTQGLEWTFLLMLIPMILASAIVFPGRKTYSRDVVTAAESVKATAGQSSPP